MENEVRSERRDGELLLSLSPLKSRLSRRPGFARVVCILKYSIKGSLSTFSSYFSDERNNRVFLSSKKKKKRSLMNP